MNTCKKKHDEKIEYFYGCKSTGIVCGGNCNNFCYICKNSVTFHNLDDALNAGFRPCIRCNCAHNLCSKTKGSLIQLAKDYLELHYIDKFSLKNMSDYLHINPDYLGRVFKSGVGETPLKYHNYVRCEHARELLENSDYTVEIISCKVGYLSESHFIKIFRSIYDVTPLQYQKNILAESRYCDTTAINIGVY